MMELVLGGVWVAFFAQLFRAWRYQRLASGKVRLNWLFIFFIILTLDLQNARGLWLAELGLGVFFPHYVKGVAILMAVHIAQLILHDQYPKRIRTFVMWSSPILLIGITIIFIVCTPLYPETISEADWPNNTIIMLRDLGMMIICIATVPVLVSAFRIETRGLTRIRLGLQIALVISVIYGALDSIPMWVSMVVLNDMDLYSSIIQLRINTNLISGVLIALWVTPFRYLRAFFMPQRVYTLIRLRSLHRDITPHAESFNWRAIVEIDLGIYREFIGILDKARQQQIQPILEVSEQHPDYADCVKALASLKLS